MMGFQPLHRTKKMQDIEPEKQHKPSQNDTQPPQAKENTKCKPETYNATKSLANKKRNRSSNPTATISSRTTSLLAQK
jgi:hypothetical protein